MRRPGGRKRALGTRAPMTLPQGPNQRWSLDFLSDGFSDGRRFSIIASVDDFTRECLALVPDTSLPGLRVARELDVLIAARGRPAMWSPTTVPSSPAWRSCDGHRRQGSNGITSRRESRVLHKSLRAPFNWCCWLPDFGWIVSGALCH